MNNKITTSGLSFSVEVLGPENYSDLVRVRRPGSKFKPARAIAVSYKDLFVLTRFRGKPFGAIAAAIDSRLDGAIDKAIEADSFQSRQGETLVVDLEARGLASGNARKAVVIGLGDQSVYGRFIYCGLIGTVISQAAKLDAEQVMLFLPDLNGASDELSVKQFAAVLMCRLRQHLAADVEHGRLKLFRLVVSADMKEEIEAGLFEREPLCRICVDPAI